MVILVLNCGSSSIKYQVIDMEDASSKLLVPVQDVGSVQKAITEGTNGRAGIEKDQELYYAVIDGKVITFDH